MKLVNRVMGIVLFGAIVACSAAAPADSTNEDDQTGVPASPKGGGGDDGGGGGNPTAPPAPPSGASCGADDFLKADLSTLTACGNGKGHCYDKTKTDLAAALEPCADASKVCVPDDILEANGAKPKSCTSIIGAGGCVTAPLFPEIMSQGSAYLKQDVCDSGQLCVPCTDPQHGNAPTPFCQPIGVHKNSCGAQAGSADAGPPAAACCTNKKTGKSHGTCLSKDSIPADQQSSTSQLECPTGEVCAPTALVSGKPVACNSGLFGKGICLDTCFNGTMALAGDIGLLSSKGCDESELCIPCSFVSGQGVPVPGC